MQSYQQKMDAIKKSISCSYKNKPRKNQQSIKQTLKNKCTNFLFKINSIQISNLWKRQDITSQNYILGQHYQNQLQLEKEFKKIIWFTYRTHFNISQNLHSDTGWGCLLRVGQMILAAGLVKFYQSNIRQRNSSQQLQTIKNILYAFLDDQGKQQKYSLTCMMKIAEAQFKITPGQWFNIGQISYIVEKLQNRNPMKGSENFKVIAFNQSIIFLNDIFSLLQIQLCSCKPQKIRCEICHFIKSKSQASNQIRQQTFDFNSENSDIDSQSLQSPQDELKKAVSLQKQYQSPQKQIIIIVIARTGLNKIPQSSKQAIFSLLKHRTSVGIMGGIPKKALYITGVKSKQLLYLDPHYVQQSVSRKTFEKKINTFHCQQIRKIDVQELDPSMGFGFYVKNLEDLEDLINLIDNLKKNKKLDFMSYMWESQRTMSVDNTMSYQFSDLGQQQFEP